MCFDGIDQETRRTSAARKNPAAAISRVCFWECEA